MQFRTFPNTEIAPVSVIGFGTWTISTGWWGKYTEGEAIELLQYAFDQGINFYDAADTYGNGYSEELLAKAFADRRDDVVIATKVGYNFYDHGNERRGQREIPQDFSVGFIEEAIDKALSRLKTDRIDLLQLHNIRMEQVFDDKLWEVLEVQKEKGKILGYGVALGPAIGWKYEGIQTIKQRNPHVLQHIYNMLEQFPGQPIMDACEEDSPSRFLIRVTHSSGMLEGKYTEDTVFGENDHRRHRPRTWLINGIKKVDNIRFIENENRTLGQAALLWLLANERIASCLPNVYGKDQIKEFADAGDLPSLSSEEMEKLAELWKSNFGVEEAPCNFKGTMTDEELDEALSELNVAS